MELYKLSPGLFKAFKNTRNGALYSEARGAVPTHAGGGTLLDGKGTLIDQESIMLHDRALAILQPAASSGMTYGTALKLARKELAEKRKAEARGPQFSEVRFAEGGKIPVDQDSVLVARRADAIMAERKISFGEALKMARAEARERT